MLFVLEQVGQMMVEPAYIAGTGPDTVHKEQRPLRIILSGKGPVRSSALSRSLGDRSQKL